MQCLDIILVAILIMIISNKEEFSHTIHTPDYPDFDHQNPHRRGTDHICLSDLCLLLHLHLCTSTAPAPYPKTLLTPFCPRRHQLDLPHAALYSHLTSSTSQLYVFRESPASLGGRSQMHNYSLSYQ